MATRGCSPSCSRTRRLAGAVSWVAPTATPACTAIGNFTTPIKRFKIAPPSRSSLSDAEALAIGPHELDVCIRRLARGNFVRFDRLLECLFQLPDLARRRQTE